MSFSQSLCVAHAPAPTTTATAIDTEWRKSAAISFGFGCAGTLCTISVFSHADRASARSLPFRQKAEWQKLNYCIWLRESRYCRQSINTAPRLQPQRMPSLSECILGARLRARHHVSNLEHFDRTHSHCIWHSLISERIGVDERCRCPCAGRKRTFVLKRNLFKFK